MMNILIIGEFSGFAKHLKAGFRLLGHNVTVVQSGDGWKKLGDAEDIMMPSNNLSFLGCDIKGTSRLRYLFFRKRLIQLIEKKCNNPSLIIVINYEFLSNSLIQWGVPLHYIESKIRNGSKLIMSICGSDPAFQYRYKDLCDKIGFSKPIKDKRFMFLIKNADSIIPTSYCYYDSILEYCKHFDIKYARIKKTIPLPVKVENLYTFSSCEDHKIVIFHGISRPQVKGTGYIKDAMERIQKDFPHSVECVCEGGLPYNDYIKLFDKIDVLIDQTNLNGWGYNAAIAAMKGKCVLTSCGKENEKAMSIDKIPFVQIGPDSDLIYNTLKKLVTNPQEIDRIKIQSRQFIIDHCECSIIAQRYIDTVSI